MPVVSMTMASSLSSPAAERAASFLMMAIRSCRTLQQMQPLSVSIISSSLWKALPRRIDGGGLVRERRTQRRQRWLEGERACKAVLTDVETMAWRRRPVLGDELVVDRGVAELVLDDGDLLAVRRGQDVVEKRRLAGAEEARQDGHGDALHLSASPDASTAPVQFGRGC